VVLILQELFAHCIRYPEMRQKGQGKPGLRGDSQQHLFERNVLQGATWPSGSAGNVEGSHNSQHNLMVDALPDRWESG
jgi:hypothetical protein